MKLKLFLYLIVFCTIVSCNQASKLYEINTPEQMLEVIKNTPETTNRELPLTYYEKMNVHFLYRKVKTIYENEQFKVIVILGKKRGKKFYHLIARTVNKNNNKALDTFLLSSYNDETKEFCSGYIDDKLKVSRTCPNVNFTLQKQIDTFGKLTQIKK